LAHAENFIHSNSKIMEIIGFGQPFSRGSDEIIKSAEPPIRLGAPLFLYTNLQKNEQFIFSAIIRRDLFRRSAWFQDFRAVV